VETFLFNLFRGASSGGLAGMSALTTRTIGGVELQIARPLLGVWREEIERYVDKHDLPFREDQSNADRRFTRNRLRHEIIPTIEQAFGRDIRRAVWRTAELLRAENDLIATLLGPQALPAELSVPALREEPLALQRRRLRAWLKARGIPKVGFAEVEAVRQLLEGRTAKTNLPGGWHARRRAGKLFLERLSP
jgi:tRNA(Ile)-lysidine synthase